MALGIQLLVHSSCVSSSGSNILGARPPKADRNPRCKNDPAKPVFFFVLGVGSFDLFGPHPTLPLQQPRPCGDATVFFARRRAPLTGAMPSFRRHEVRPKGRGPKLRTPLVFSSRAVGPINAQRSSMGSVSEWVPKRFVFGGPPLTCSCSASMINGNTDETKVQRPDGCFDCGLHVM